MPKFTVFICDGAGKPMKDEVSVHFRQGMKNLPSASVSGGSVEVDLNVDTTQTLAVVASRSKYHDCGLLLNPAELGHVRFEIHHKGDHVQVVLSAERPETLDLLRRNTDQLTAEFRDAGFAGSALSFGQWGRNTDDRAPPARFAADTGDDFVPQIPPQISQSSRDPARNLNLRL